MNEAWMVLKVDLSCPDCYKSIKKILCNIHEIRDQVYDKNGNKVKIIAVCCCPERLRDKLYRKGKKVIKSIEIIKPVASNATTDQPPPPVSPPQGNVVIGVPIPAKYFPFPLGYGCPVCSGDNVSCPFCHGNGKSIPQPP